MKNQSILTAVVAVCLMLAAGNAQAGLLSGFGGGCCQKAACCQKAPGACCQKAHGVGQKAAGVCCQKAHGACQKGCGCHRPLMNLHGWLAAVRCHQCCVPCCPAPCQKGHGACQKGHGACQKAACCQK